LKDLRVGHGYDVHRLEEGRPLMLGGERIPHPRGLAGHSDADVLLHALGDALLGAAGLGDLGTHFPPDDERWRDASSIDLLARIVAMLASAGWEPQQCDLTLLAEAPRIAPYRGAICARVAGILRVPASAVSLKATTCEGLGFVGREEGMAAMAVVLVSARRADDLRPPGEGT